MGRPPRYLKQERWCEGGQHYVTAPLDLKLYCHGKLVRSGPRRQQKDKQRLREAFPEMYFPGRFPGQKTVITVVLRNEW